MKFSLHKNSQLTDMFHCPLWQLSKVKISFKTCINRQPAKTPYGTPLYDECILCATGKRIAKHFSKYIPILKEQKKNHNFKKLEASRKAAELRDKLRMDLRGKGRKEK